MTEEEGRQEYLTQIEQWRNEKRTLRDEFAMAALTGLLTAFGNSDEHHAWEEAESPQDYSWEAYSFADAMMERRTQYIMDIRSSVTGNREGRADLLDHIDNLLAMDYAEERKPFSNKHMESLLDGIAEIVSKRGKRLGKPANDVQT